VTYISVQNNLCTAWLKSCATMHATVQTFISKIQN